MLLNSPWMKKLPLSILRRSGPVREAAVAALDLLDSGKARVAEKTGDGWTVNQWLKKAVLLSFRLNPMEIVKGGPGESAWWDKVASKFDGWSVTEKPPYA